MKNLADANKDYATFLPAISGFYSSMLAKEINDPIERVEAQRLLDEQLALDKKEQDEKQIAKLEKRLAKPPFITDERVPNGFEHGVQGMNFLDPDNGYFYYSKCLYSAGHAYLDIEKSKVHEAMVQGRDRTKITLVGDSGGYQIGKGVIKFDWERFYEEEAKPETWVGDKYVGSANKVRMDILRWLEHTAEWSMSLDVPSWASSPANRGKTGLQSFDDCLAATIYNNEFFSKNRVPGATKFLNVLQGGDFSEAQTWYEAVKHFPFEGWAFGGNNMCDMSMALRRLIILRDEGMLEGRDWIHFLGTSKLDWACYLTAIQRQLRKHVNPNLTVSFDCASPFIAVANGLTYTSYFHMPDKWTYSMDSCPDNKALKGSEMAYPFESEIGKRLNMGDVCAYGEKYAIINGNIRHDVTKEEVMELQEAGADATWIEADLNKIGKNGKTSWDSFSYCLVMAHSVYQHIRAVQVANELTDVECVTHKPNIRDWKKLKGKDKSGELSNWVPRNILYFNSFVEELFEHDDPMTFIDENITFLNAIGRRRPGTSGEAHFGILFDEVLEHADDEGFSEEQEAVLDKLENEVRDE